MAGDLEQLAQRGREQQERAARYQRVQLQYAQAARERDADRMVRRALGHHVRPATLAIAVPLGLAAVIIPMVLSPMGGVLDFIVTMGVAALGMGAVIAAVLLLGRRRYAAQMRWLQSLPFSFASEAYLHALAEQRFTSLVTLSLRLGRPASDAERATIGAAISGGADIHGWAWQSDFLQVVSPRLTTGRMNYGSTTNMPQTASFDNAPIHRWLRATVEGALLTVHARYPLNSVSVHVAEAH